MPKVRIVLLTGRSIDQGVGKELGKLSKEYQASVTACEMDPEDLRIVGLSGNDSVRVTTEYGSVVLRAAESKRAPHPGVAYVPYGLWANVVIGPRTHGTGMPSFKGVPADLEPAKGEEVMGVQELLQKLYGK